MSERLSSCQQKYPHASFQPPPLATAPAAEALGQERQGQELSRFLELTDDPSCSHSCFSQWQPLNVVDDGGALLPVRAADPPASHLIVLIAISPDLMAVSGVTAAAALRAGHLW